MKSLNEYLNSTTLTESFESPVINKLFYSDTKKRSWSYGLSKTILKQYTWDKISNDNIKELDINTAVTLARKQKDKFDNPSLIIWVEGDLMSGDNPIALTLNTDILLFWNGAANWHGGNHKIPTIPQLSNMSSKAYLIENSKSYETSELQRARREAKNNAMALKTNEQIRQENKVRYEEAILKATSINRQDIAGWLRNSIEVYNDCMNIAQNKLAAIVLNSQYSKQISNTLEAISEMSTRMRNIVDTINDTDRSATEIEEYGETPNFMLKKIKSNHDWIVKETQYIQRMLENLPNIEGVATEG